MQREVVLMIIAWAALKIMLGNNGYITSTQLTLQFLFLTTNAAARAT